ncbi:MAG: exonuclease subunit SbcD [Treponema sp.]|nr:exonuclease subunit SbcD [Treponema sp.]
MRFLHTGDWHLGRIFHEVSLLEEQEYFMEQILSLLEKAKKENNPFAALCISGDIYDRVIPSAAAVEVFSNFLVKIHEGFPELHVFLLSGNHDSAKRLGFASSLLESSNIHIATETSNKNITKAVIVNGVAFYQLPFLNPLSIEAKDEFSTPAHSQSEMYEIANARILDFHKANYPDMPCVLCAHGTFFDTVDETLVGTAENVNPKVFDGFSYVALGHIHKCMKIGESGRIYYSGSPLSYNFGENKNYGESAKKYFLDVSIDEKEGINAAVSVNKIEVKALHSVVTLKGKFSDINDPDFAKAYKDCFVEVICTDNYVVENPMDMLEINYPYILSFRKEKAIAANENTSIELRKKVFDTSLSSPVHDVMPDVFKVFIEDINGSNVDDKVHKAEIELFSKLCNEINTSKQE